MEKSNDISLVAVFLEPIALNLILIIKDFYLTLRFAMQAFLNIILYIWRVSAAKESTPSELSTAKVDADSTQEEEMVTEKPVSLSKTKNDEMLSKNVDDELTIDEMTMVLRNLGTLYDLDDEKLQERVSSSDIATVFEEQEPSFQEVKDAFWVFDENDDGFIDANELKKVICALGFTATSEQDCQRMIRAYDKNGDELIDFNEFIRLVANSFD